jgi:hypothetical protein
MCLIKGAFVGEKNFERLDIITKRLYMSKIAIVAP